MRRWAPLIIAIALFAGTFLVYMRSLNAEFVLWDDNVQLVENQKLGGFSKARIIWAFTDVETATRYIPLTLLGWIATYQIWERNPFGYHLGNNLLQCGSVVLAFAVLARLLRFFGRPPAGLQRNEANWTWLCAAIGAVLWGWHPMRVEVVAWATTRTYCQSIFFLLLFLWLYLRMITTSPGKVTYTLALMAYALSLLSYPLGLTVPAALLVLDVYPFRRANFRWRFWKDRALCWCALEKVPMIAIALVVLVLGLMARTYTGGKYQAPLTSLEVFGIIPRLMQACYLLMYYLWRPWWPADLTPVRTELVWFSPGDWPFVVSAAGLFAVTIVLIVTRRRWPLALSLWLVHVIVLLPVLGWTEYPHYPSDRYSTLQGLLWPFVIAWIVWRWGLKRQLPTQVKCATIMAAVVGALSIVTVRQVGVWHDSVTLFRHMMSKVDPRHVYQSDFHRRLGHYFTSLPKPEYELAEQEFQAALRFVPDNTNIRILLAMVLRHQNRITRAESVLRDGLIRNPDSTELRIMLGQVLLQQSKVGEAIDQFNQVLQRDPNNAPAREGLAAARKIL